MNRKMVAIGVAVAGILAIVLGVAAWHRAQEAKQAAFRALVAPVVAKVGDRVKGAASLAGGTGPSSSQADAWLADLAGYDADLKALEPVGPRQEELLADARAFQSAAQAFVRAQQDYARVMARLVAARVRVKESLDGRQRASQHSLGFWQETHDRLVRELEKARADAIKARDAFAATSGATQQAAESAAATVGEAASSTAQALAAHKQALTALELAKD